MSNSRHKKKIARERLAILKNGRWASFADKSNPQYTRTRQNLQLSQNYDDAHDYAKVSAP